MIKTWADREAETIFNNEVSRRLGPQVSKVARRKLKMLNAATNVTDLRVPPGNRLEALKGDRKGQHSIRVNDRTGSASAGATAMPSTSRSWTTTEEHQHDQHDVEADAPR